MNQQHVARKLRDILSLGGHDDDGFDNLFQQTSDPRKHCLAAKRQPRLRPSHPAALTPTKYDARHREGGLELSRNFTRTHSNTRN